MTNPWLFFLGVIAFLTLGAAVLGAPGPWIFIGGAVGIVTLALAAVQRMIRDAVNDLAAERVTD